MRKHAILVSGLVSSVTILVQCMTSEVLRAIFDWKASFIVHMKLDLPNARWCVLTPSVPRPFLWADQAQFTREGTAYFPRARPESMTLHRRKNDTGDCDIAGSCLSDVAARSRWAWGYARCQVRLPRDMGESSHVTKSYYVL